MNRVRRIAAQIIKSYPDLFSDDFEKNKEALTKVTVIRSKQLRNEIAGYITSSIRADSRAEPNEKIEETEVEG